MLCPACNGEMWDNREKKLTPKAPDFKCKDKECKFEYDKETDQWVNSEFTTSVWLPKEKVFAGTKSPVQQSQPSSNNPPATVHKNGSDYSVKSMIMSYAKDLVCAELAQGVLQEGGVAVNVITIYKLLLTEIQK